MVCESVLFSSISRITPSSHSVFALYNSDQGHILKYELVEESYFYFQSEDDVLVRSVTPLLFFLSTLLLSPKPPAL